MPSIKDVAKYCGCSTSTISRVINNRDAVDPETKKRVLQAIDELGYKPNLVAQGLRVKRGNLVGLVVPDESSAFTEMMYHAMETARRRGFNIIFGSTHNDPDIEAAFIDDLIRRHINGIIFSRVSDESRVLHKINTQEVPVVIVDRTLDYEGIPSVVLNNERAGEIAAQHFLYLGHKNIACVTGPQKIKLCRERLKGIKNHLEKSGISLPETNIFEGKWQFESGIDAVNAFNKKRLFPTAIWAFNDIMAFGVLKRLAELGIRVPDDVSVLGMDDVRFSRMVSPSLSTIHYPLDEMAEKAFEYLTGDYDKNIKDSLVTVLEPSLIVRESSSKAM